MKTDYGIKIMTNSFNNVNIFICNKSSELSIFYCCLTFEDKTMIMTPTYYIVFEVFKIMVKYFNYEHVKDIIKINKHKISTYNEGKGRLYLQCDDYKNEELVDNCYNNI